MIDILSCKFTNDVCTTPSNNLVGGLSGKLYAEIDFIVHWDLIGEDLTFFQDQIARNDGGDYILDGFRVGQTIYVEYAGTDSSPANVGEYIIVNISSGVLTVDEITSSSSDSELSNGTLPFATEIGTFDYNIHGTTKVQNSNFYFGLVENSASPQYISLLDGETQKYTINGLDADGGNTYPLVIASSNKSWVTGSSDDISDTTIEELGIGTSGVSTGFEQRFKIHLPFYIFPAYSDTLEDANGELLQSLFPQLSGANTLKFVYKIEAGTDNSSIIFSTDNGNINAFINNGDVGFYDQYRNTATTPEYSITSIEYLDPNSNEVSAMIKNATTTVNIVLNSLNGRFSTPETRVQFTVYEIPEDFSDVKNNANTAWENFEVSRFSVLVDSGTSSDNKVVDLDVTLVNANSINITFDYTAPNADKKYVIVSELSRYDELDLTSSDGNTVLCAFDEFVYNVDLSTIYVSDNGIMVNEHSSNSVERSFTDYKGWIEDGVLFTNNFTILSVGGYSDELTVSLRSVALKIEVVNSTDSSRNFTLEEFTLLPPNDDQGRTFILPTDDPKNYLYIEETASSISSTSYSIQYATKLRWETWFSQANADPDFTAPTKDWSQYITGDWSVKMNMYFSLGATDEENNRYTFTITHGVDVGIKDYEEVDGCSMDWTIETFHQPTMTNLDGLLSKTANTFVRATFYGKKLFPCVWDANDDCTYSQIISGSGSASDSNGEIADLDCPELYGILELDDEQVGGTSFIKQISTMYDPETGTPWIGESGVRAKITHYPFATNPCSVVEAVLDIDQLDLNANYKLSARIGEIARTICDVAIFQLIESAVAFYYNSALVGFSETDILVWSLGGKLSNSLGYIDSVTDGTITLTGANKFLRAIKIVCAVGRIDDTKSGDFYTNASLVGLDICDFCFFLSNGLELTSQPSLYTFTSGTGTLTFAGFTGDIIIDFREAFICEDVSAITTYTDPVLANYSDNELLIFCQGQELFTVLACTKSGDTLTFSTAITGKLKICLVNG